MNRAALLLLATGCWVACQDGSAAHPDSARQLASGPVPPAPPTRSPAPRDRGPDPLDLCAVGLAGSGDCRTVGHFGDTPIAIDELEARAGGVFARIAGRVFAACAAGAEWARQRAALAEQAAATDLPLGVWLRWQEVATRSRSDLESEDDAALAARSRSRLAAWRRGRNGLVQARPFVLVEPTPTCGGYRAALARREYFRFIERELEGLVDDRLLAAIAVEPTPPPVTEAELDGLLARRPEFAADPHGRDRARIMLRQKHRADARARAVAERRAATDIALDVVEPRFQIALEVPAPRRQPAGDKSSVLLALHGLGCGDCERGSALILRLLDRFPELALRAGDHFDGDRLVSYRYANALHCAADQNALVPALTVLTPLGATATLAAIEHAAGATVADPRRFSNCLRDDDHLADVVENLAYAEHLGLEGDVPALFVDGVRLGHLGDFDAVVTQVAEILSGP